MPVTHQQIAERLGVSRTLVTGSLHGTRGAGISPETQQLILRTAREMGYVPRNRTTHTIGVIVQGSSLQGEAFGVFLGKIEAALQRRKYRVALMAVWDNNVAAVQDSLTSKNVDGLIVTESFENRVQQVLPPQIPAVFTVDEDEMKPDCDVVTIDSSGTLEKATNLLLQHGHRQIALLTMHDPLPVYRHMEQGALRAFACAGVPRHGLRVLQLDYGRHGNLKPAEFGGRLIEELQKSPACTALIAADLWRAIPATYALRDAGFRIPEDISVISVFDSEYFPAMHPPITATTIYAQTIAERAVERLLKKIEDPHNSPCHERVPGELIERASVGPPRTGGKRLARGE